MLSFLESLKKYFPITGPSNSDYKKSNEKKNGDDKFLQRFLAELSIGKVIPPNKLYEEPLIGSPLFLNPQNNYQLELYRLMKRIEPRKSFIYGTYQPSWLYINPFYDSAECLIPNLEQGFVFPLDENGRLIIRPEDLMLLKLAFDAIVPVANMDYEFPPDFQNFLLGLEKATKDMSYYENLAYLRNKFCSSGYVLPENPEDFKNAIKLQEACLEAGTVVYIGPIVGCYLSAIAYGFKEKFRRHLEKLGETDLDLTEKIILTNVTNFFKEIIIRTAPPPNFWPPYEYITPCIANERARRYVYKINYIYMDQ